MMALLTRFGFGGIGFKGLTASILVVSGLVLVTWLSTKLYLAGIHAERVKTLEAKIARIEAELIANEAVIRQAEADARDAEAEERKLKELIDVLQKDRSCPLTRDHVDGVRRIDESP